MLSCDVAMGELSLAGDFCDDRRKGRCPFVLMGNTEKTRTISFSEPTAVSDAEPIGVPDESIIIILSGL